MFCLSVEGTSELPQSQVVLGFQLKPGYRLLLEGGRSMGFLFLDAACSDEAYFERDHTLNVKRINQVIRSAVLMTY